MYLVSLNKFFEINFGNDRWKFLVEGTLFVIKCTALATIIGLAVGIMLAIFKLSNSYFEQSKYPKMAKYNVFSWFASAYIYIIRGTPVLVQLMIFNTVVFVGNLRDTEKLYIAVIAFGLNSAAYVAEIVRSGIQSLDKGQMEAARALGMPYSKSMQLIVLPQAFKNMLPTFVNEFIVLIKETSVVAFIGGFDLFKASEKITAITYNGSMPLYAIAIIYLLLTTIFTFIMHFVERRVRKGD